MLTTLDLLLLASVCGVLAADVKLDLADQGSTNLVVPPGSHGKPTSSGDSSWQALAKKQKRSVPLPVKESLPTKAANQLSNATEAFPKPLPNVWQRFRRGIQVSAFMGQSRSWPKDQKISYVIDASLGIGYAFNNLNVFFLVVQARKCRT